ncbi:hypothetical protein ADK45_10830 [Streptomyces rimosus subsp. rimosus]|nr:hypothetical protein ADK45_10830 [Streptomyces rimosus subsp. rimosus]
MAGGVGGVAQPFPDGGGQLAGVVPGPFEDFGGVAQLVGELDQYCLLLVAVACRSEDLQEFVEGRGQR